MKIGVVSRFDMEEALELAKQIVNEFPDSDLLLDEGSANSLGRSDGIPISEMNEFDALISIGGDGTVLHTQQKAPGAPILGINMGQTGFLADVPPEKASDAVKKLIKNELEISELLKLSVETSGERLPDALNEAVVRSAEPGSALNFKINVDKNEVEEIKGDGLIVSTPTGSTAYALAAGGPIIDPRLKAFVLVPVSARPSRTPLVVPTDCEIKMSLSPPKGNANIIVDGRVVGEAESGESVIFGLSENTAKFFDYENNFYRKVREKL